MMGEGLGNHPLANLSAAVWARCGTMEEESVGGVRFPRMGNEAGKGGAPSLEPVMGVIRGKGKPAFKMVADDVETLLPQLELKLPVAQVPSSRPRTVNRRVKSSAFVGWDGFVRGIRCNLTVMPLYDNGIAPYMYSAIASKSRSVYMSTFASELTQTRFGGGEYRPLRNTRSSFCESYKYTLSFLPASSFSINTLAPATASRGDSGTNLALAFAHSQAYQKVTHGATVCFLKFPLPRRQATSPSVQLHSSPH